MDTTRPLRTAPDDGRGSGVTRHKQRLVRTSRTTSTVSTTGVPTFSNNVSYSTVYRTTPTSVSTDTRVGPFTVKVVSPNTQNGTRSTRRDPTSSTHVCSRYGVTSPTSDGTPSRKRVWPFPTSIGLWTGATSVSPTPTYVTSCTTVSGGSTMSSWVSRSSVVRVGDGRSRTGPAGGSLDCVGSSTVSSTSGTWRPQPWTIAVVSGRTRGPRTCPTRRCPLSVTPMLVSSGRGGGRVRAGTVSTSLRSRRILFRVVPETVGSSRVRPLSPVSLKVLRRGGPS